MAIKGKAALKNELLNGQILEESKIADLIDSAPNKVDDPQYRGDVFGGVYNKGDLCVFANDIWLTLVSYGGSFNASKSLNMTNTASNLAATGFSEWLNGTNYTTVDQFVTYQGNIYKSLNNSGNIGREPGTTSGATYWQVIVFGRNFGPYQQAYYLADTIFLYADSAFLVTSNHDFTGLEDPTTLLDTIIQNWPLLQAWQQTDDMGGKSFIDVFSGLLFNGDLEADLVGSLMRMTVNMQPLATLDGSGWSHPTKPSRFYRYTDGDDNEYVLFSGSNGAMTATAMLIHPTTDFGNISVAGGVFAFTSALGGGGSPSLTTDKMWLGVSNVPTEKTAAQIRTFLDAYTTTAATAALALKADASALSSYQLLSAKAAASGYASLDSGTKVPKAQLQNLINDSSTGTTETFSASRILTLLAGLLDFRGGYNASGNAFPSSGGSGTSGAILKGDFWLITTGGTLGGTAVVAGDSIFANVDTPGTTVGNWVFISKGDAIPDLDAVLTAGNMTDQDIISTGKASFVERISVKNTSGGDEIFSVDAVARQIALRFVDGDSTGFTIDDSTHLLTFGGKLKYDSLASIIDDEDVPHKAYVDAQVAGGIPLAGTAMGAPVTGDIEVSGQVFIYGNASDETKDVSICLNPDSGFVQIQAHDNDTGDVASITTEPNRITVAGSSGTFAGMADAADYSANKTTLDYATKGMLDEAIATGIPLTGTVDPVTGDIEFETAGDQRKVFFNGTDFNGDITLDGGGGIAAHVEEVATGFITTISIGGGNIGVNSDDPDFAGISDAADYSAAKTALNYATKGMLDANSFEEISRTIPDAAASIDFTWTATGNQYQRGCLSIPDTNTADTLPVAPGVVKLGLFSIESAKSTDFTVDLTGQTLPAGYPSKYLLKSGESLSLRVDYQFAGVLLTPSYTPNGFTSLSDTGAVDYDVLDTDKTILAARSASSITDFPIQLFDTYPLGQPLTIKDYGVISISTGVISVTLLADQFDTGSGSMTITDSKFCLTVMRVSGNNWAILNQG